MVVGAQECCMRRVRAESFGPFESSGLSRNLAAAEMAPELELSMVAEEQRLLEGDNLEDRAVLVERDIQDLVEQMLALLERTMDWG